ncbi:hypothetical protein B0H13DRAFT_1979776 [Mycena leptocephala]|nr:hypothetical protein B0H13DRAFT_1979776 [Mycena leptocephala]
MYFPLLVLIYRLRSSAPAGIPGQSRRPLLSPFLLDFPLAGFLSNGTLGPALMCMLPATRCCSTPAAARLPPSDAHCPPAARALTVRPAASIYTLYCLLAHPRARLRFLSHVPGFSGTVWAPTFFSGLPTVGVLWIGCTAIFYLSLCLVE